MRRIAGYTILEALNSTPEYMLLRARQGERPVLLRFPANEYPTPDEIARLRHGYEMQRSLDAPGVVRALALEEHERTLVMVSADDSGSPLRSILRGNALGLQEALRIGLHLAQTLGELHQRGVVHQRVNPANVFVESSSCAVKLAHYEWSCALSGESAAALGPGRLEEELPYISPEQTGRMNRGIDHRTDFYSLGVTLYEMLTGRLPFLETDPIALVHCHIAVEPESPSRVSPAVPPAVSSIVLKLLSKNAEDRYQSAYGVAADLSSCLRQLMEAGEIGMLVAGENDAPATFQLAYRLYGRDAEKTLLLAAFERVAAGATEVCMIAGRSGTGKSSLVNDIQKPVVRKGGRFVSGKFEQLHPVPHGALIQAFRQLINQILWTTAEEIQAICERLVEALGSNGRVITDLIPEVELIVGPQPELPALGGTEAQIRLNLVFREFVAVFARGDAPLAIFVDDLQWADPASLRLLERLVCDEGLRNLYVVGAYRVDEVDALHPLTSMIGRIRGEGVATTEIPLEPLARRQVDALIADALGRPDPDAVSALVDVVQMVTEGNPLFINQFLSALYVRRLLTFDAKQGRWRWSITELQRADVPDSVAGLMVARIRRLSRETQQVLQLAACIGHAFDVRELALISERSSQEVAEQLSEAVRDGIVVPQDERSQHAPGAEAGRARFAFFHDRVQEAAYSLLPDDGTRAAVHLRVGRLLLANTAAQDLEARIFDIVDQFVLSLPLIEGASERLALAALNLRAGKKAKDATAYSAAVKYLDAGLSLLGERGWESSHSIMYALSRQRAECAYLLGESDGAERDFDRILQLARSREERVEIQELRMELLLGQGMFDKALEAGLDALRSFGMEMPSADALLADCQSEGQVVAALMAGRTVASIAELPEAEDPAQRAIIRLLAQCAYVAFSDPLRLTSVTLRLVRSCLEHGNAPCAGFGYVTYGLIVSRSGDFATAHDLGTLGNTLCERLDKGAWRGITTFMVGAFLRPWRKPPRTSGALLEEAHRTCLEAGSLMFAGLAKMQAAILDFLAGSELDGFMERSAAFILLQRRLRLRDLAAMTSHLRGLALCLKGEQPEASSSFDVTTLSTQFQHFPPVLASSAIASLGVSYLLRDFARARELAKLAEAGVDSLTGHVNLVEWAFNRALLAAELHPSGTPSEQQQYRSTIAEEYVKLTRWAELCPANFEHKALLVAAEMARLNGAADDALALYDRAIKSAAESGFLHLEALAGELCARLYLARGQAKAARAYLADARYTYARWGASAKVAQLDDEFSDLLPRARTTNSEAAASSHDVDSLDLLSVIKASQALSGEIVLTELLRKLMRTLLENAGAQRGLLILTGTPDVFVAANDAADSRVVTREEAESFGYARSLVRYVQRTGEAVVHGDAADANALAADPYVAQVRPRSVLCMPVVKQRKQLGVLYMENNIARFAFTPERCKILELLSAQAAISIENAQLYDTLESRVRARTQELADRNEELSQVVARLNATRQQLVAHEKLASLGTLTAGVAHELKNPLNFVCNFAALSVDLSDELTQEVSAISRAGDEQAYQGISEVVGMLRGNVAKIAEHGKRADDIVNNMLSHARGASSAREAIDINGLVAACIQLAASGRGGRQRLLAYVHESYDGTVGMVEAASDDLRRVFVNLLNNANDALEEKLRLAGSGYQPVIQVTTRAADDAVEVTVRDNGVGIPSEVIPNIFDPFFTTKSAGKGTGLGLSICHGIVQAHRGEIRLNTALGEYTEFTVRLPARESPRAGLEHTQAST